MSIMTNIANRFGLVLAALVVAVLSVSFVALIPSAHADITDSDRPAIEDIIRDYLLDNPEVVRDALIELQAREQRLAEERQREGVRLFRSQLENFPGMPVVGNPDGDVTIVEFFDYNCGFCSRALADLEAVIEADNNVRVVLFEMPILSEASVDAARISIAAAEVAPKKYMEFHSALLSARGAKNGERAFGVADALGIDRSKLAEKAETPEVAAVIQNALMIAQEIGIDGTPSYVIGDQVLGGRVGPEALMEAVRAVREENDG